MWDVVLLVRALLVLTWVQLERNPLLTVSDSEDDDILATPLCSSSESEAEHDVGDDEAREKSVRDDDREHREHVPDGGL